MGLLEVAFDSRVLDRAVHSFDLPIGPWMLGLCQPVIDVVLGAGVFEGVRPNELSSLQGGLDVRRRRARIAWRSEVGSVVGEDGRDGQNRFTSERAFISAAEELLRGIRKGFVSATLPDGKLLDEAAMRALD